MLGVVEPSAWFFVLIFLPLRHKGHFMEADSTFGCESKERGL